MNNMSTEIGMYINEGLLCQGKFHLPQDAALNYEFSFSNIVITRKRDDKEGQFNFS